MLDGVPALQDPAEWGVVTREADENMRVRTAEARVKHRVLCIPHRMHLGVLAQLPGGGRALPES